MCIVASWLSAVKIFPNDMLGLEFMLFDFVAESSFQGSTANLI